MEKREESFPIAATHPDGMSLHFLLIKQRER